MSERFQGLNLVTQIAYFYYTGVGDGLIVHNDWLPTASATAVTALQRQI